MKTENYYELLKDFEYPNGKIYKGVIKNEDDWLSIFPMMEKRDFLIKKDWFMLVSK